MFGYFWHRIPFFRFLFPLLLGILCGFSCPISTRHFIFLIGVIFLFFLLQVFLKSIRFRSLIQGFCVFLLFFELGLFRSHLFSVQNNYQKHSLVDEQLIIKINDLPALQSNRMKCIAEIFNTSDFLNNSPASGKCLVYFDSSFYFSIVPGLCYLIPSSKLQAIPSALNPGEFNYQKYLSLKGIFYQVDFTKSNPFSFYKSSNNFANNYAFQSQIFIRKTLYHYIPENEIRAVAMALLYGYDDEISKELSQQYAITGTLHVLAVSGMHVGLVFLFLETILVFLDKNQFLKLIKTCIILSCIWFYSLLCGLSPSILRAAVMISFFVVSKLLQRVYNPVNTLSASAFLLLMVQPELVYDAGFQLSYFAVLGLSLFYQPIYLWFEPKSWLSDQTWKLIAASTAAQITTFPLSLFYFHQFPILFLLSNLLIIPLSTIAIYCGIAALAVSSFPILANVLITCLKSIIGLCNYLAAVFASIPFFSLSGIYINGINCCLLFVLIFLILAFIYQKQFWQIQSALLLILLLLGLSIYNYFQVSSRSFIRVYAYAHQNCFVIVNNGNASLFADSSFVQKRNVLELLNQEFNHTQLVNLPF
ncbi:MAG: ComEC/Rec2 family competence protein, partial [Bacteroidia bacterium]